MKVLQYLTAQMRACELDFVANPQYPEGLVKYLTRRYDNEGLNAFFKGTLRRIRPPFPIAFYHR